LVNITRRKMKYLGKLFFEGVVVTLVVGVLLFSVLYFFGDKILEMFGG